MKPDEVVRREGLRFVAGRFQRVKVTILCHYEISFSRNCAVAELVVVRIRHDDVKR
jgi:hypothetical protein